MPATSVEIPNVGVVDFPEGMSQADILSAIQTNLPKWQPAPIQPESTPPFDFAQFAQGLTSPTAARAVQHQRNVEQGIQELPMSFDLGLGETLHGAGNVLAGAAADVAENVAGSADKPLANLQAAVAGQPQPLEQYIGTQTGVPRIAGQLGYGAARMMPRLAAAEAIGAAGVPSGIAQGAAFGINEKGEIIPGQAALMGTLGTVGRVGGELTAAGLNALRTSSAVSDMAQTLGAETAATVVNRYRKVVESLGKAPEVSESGGEVFSKPAALLVEELGSKYPGLTKAMAEERMRVLGSDFLSNDRVLKAFEVAGSATAINAYLAGATIPEISQLPPEQRKQAIEDSIIGNALLSLIGIIPEALSGRSIAGRNYADTTGQNTQNNQRKYLGDGEGLQGQGPDRNIAPGEPQSGGSPSQRDIVPQSGQETSASQAVIPTLDEHLANNGITPASPAPLISKAIRDHVAQVQQASDAGVVLPPEVTAPYNIKEVSNEQAQKEKVQVQGVPVSQALGNVSPELRIGDPVRVMNVDSVLARTETVDGMRYELFNGAKLKEHRATIRVTDPESGQVAVLKQFPTYNVAEAEFNNALNAATQSGPSSGPLSAAQVPGAGQPTGWLLRDTEVPNRKEIVTNLGQHIGMAMLSPKGGWRFAGDFTGTTYPTVEAAAQALIKADFPHLKQVTGPLSAAQVPTSTQPALTDSQPLIDRALSIGGGDVALKALVPHVRIRYGPLASGTPAQYQGGVITFNKPVFDFVATHSPERAQQLVNDLIAHELTHAIADTVLTPEDYVAIGESMPEQERQELLAERPDVASILNRTEQLRQLGGEFVEKLFARERNQQQRSIDPNSTFGQRVLAALQKIWDYIANAFKRFANRNSIIEQSLNKVRQAKADVLAGKVPVFDNGDPLNARALKQAMREYKQIELVRGKAEANKAMRLGQAGQVAVQSPEAQRFMEQTREAALVPSTTPEEKLKRDIMQATLKLPVIRHLLIGPANNLDTSLTMTGEAMATYQQIQAEHKAGKATDDDLSLALGDAADTMYQFHAAVQNFQSKSGPKIAALETKLLELTKKELTAMAERDVDNTLFEHFQDLGREVVDQKVDVGALKALNQAAAAFPSTVKVLKFLRETEVLKGLAHDDLRSVDDLLTFIYRNITNAPERFPHYDGSSFHSVITSAIGVGMDEIKDVLRIVRLSEPLRTDIATSQALPSSGRYSKPLNRIKTKVLDALAKGNLVEAFALYEKGIVEVGITGKEAADMAKFYGRKARQALVKLEALKRAQGGLQSILDDPSFRAQRHELYRHLNIQSIESGLGGHRIWYHQTDLSKDPVNIEWANAKEDVYKNAANANKLIADYVAYIADTESPSYDPSRRAGMLKAIEDLQYYVDVAQDPRRGRVVDSELVRMSDKVGGWFGYFHLIPKFAIGNMIGPLVDRAKLTQVVLASVITRVEAIAQNYHGKRQILLKAAQLSHPEMRLANYQSDVLNFLSSSLQNFANPYQLKAGDRIGNGEVITQADVDYFRYIRGMQNEWFAVVNNMGQHKFSAQRHVVSGILFGKAGKELVRFPYSWGPGMMPRSFPDQMPSWVEQWNKATTPEQKIEFLDSNPNFNVAFVAGIAEPDYTASYYYPRELREINHEMHQEGGELENFADLVDRVTKLQNQNAEAPETADSRLDVQRNLLNEWDVIFKRLSKLLPEKADNLKAHLQIIGGDSEYNAPRKQAIMPPGMYNYGMVMESDVASGIRGALFSFVNAHIHTLEAVRDGLSTEIGNYQEQANKPGFTEAGLRAQSKLEMSKGDRYYSWGELERAKEVLDHYITQFTNKMQLSTNPYMADRPSSIAGRLLLRGAVTTLVSRPSALARNALGGFQQITAFLREMLSMGWPTALATQTKNVIAGGLKEIPYFLTHPGNPGGRLIRDLLEDRKGKAFLGGFAKLVLDAALERQTLYDHTANVLGVNLNRNLGELVRGLWAFRSTRGAPNAKQPGWIKAHIINPAYTGLDIAVRMIGQGSVGYADSRINSVGPKLAETCEVVFRQIALRWGDKLVDGLYPARAITRGLNLGVGSELGANKIRELFRRNGISASLDKTLLDFYHRIRALREREIAEGKEPGELTSAEHLFSDEQLNQIALMVPEDVNFGNAITRSPFWSQAGWIKRLGILWGYVGQWFSRLAHFSDYMNNRGFLRRFGERLPFVMSIAIMLAITATLGMAGITWFVRHVENKVTTYPTLLDSVNAKQAANAVLFATADSIPIIGDAYNMLTGQGFRSGFDVNSRFLTINMMSDAFKMGKEIMQTGSFGRPMLQFASRYTFPLNVIGSRLPPVSGLREFTNARNLLARGARGTGLESKLRRAGGSVGDVNYSASTPYINDAINAIGRGDDEAFQKALNALVDQKRKSGSLNPESSALTALRGRNPVVSVFGTKPTEDELNRVYANLSPDLAQRARKTINSFNQALASIPRRAGAKSRSTTKRAMAGVGGRATTLRPVRLGTPRLRRLSLQRPKLRRLAA